MKLFLLTQNVNRGYDTYDSCIVCAENHEKAIQFHPNGRKFSDMGENIGYDWVKPEEVDWKIIGEASEYIDEGVILSSFNAG